MTDDILADAKEAFRLCEEREADNRREALDDLKFARLAEQWPADIRKAREEDGRPCLTINRLPAFIRQVDDDQANRWQARYADALASVNARDARSQSMAPLSFDPALKTGGARGGQFDIAVG